MKCWGRKVIHEFSVTGTQHLTGNGENQDAICYGTNKNYSVISLADGVSCCKEAKAGAQIASRSITHLLLKEGSCFLQFEKKLIAEFALSQILYELKEQAVRDLEKIEEYSSTIASVFFDRKRRKLLLFSLGDSMILGAGNGKCRILAAPSDSSLGCYVTTTEHASTVVSVKVIDLGFMESILICSDGAWTQMFLRDRIKPEVAVWLIHHEFEKLKEFLVKQKCFDDCSFVSMNLQ